MRHINVFLQCGRVLEWLVRALFTDVGAFGVLACFGDAGAFLGWGFGGCVGGGEAAFAGSG